MQVWPGKNANLENGGKDLLNMASGYGINKLDFKREREGERMTREDDQQQQSVEG